MFTTEMFILMGESLLETLYMTLVAAAVSYVLGLPLGLILVVTDADGIRPNAPVNRILGTIINALRSVPFLILLFTVIPVTRFITGTTIGPTATIVPLTIAAAPFIARMVESSVKEVDRGVIEASLSMGASVLQIVWHVNIPCILPTIIIMLILSCGNVLSVGFEKTYLLQNPLNLSASQVISTYVYEVGLKSAQFSYASAIGLFNTIVNVALLLIVNCIAKRASDISLL